MSMRNRIEKLLTVYLDDLESVKREAGWHGDSTLGMLIEFRGDLPGPSGQDRSNAKMVYELRFLVGDHALLPVAQFLIGRPVGKGVIDERYAMALLASRFYRAQTNAEIAASIGLERRQYENRLAKGRELMAKELEQLDMLRSLLAHYVGERGVMV